MHRRYWIRAGTTAVKAFLAAMPRADNCRRVLHVHYFALQQREALVMAIRIETVHGAVPSEEQYRSLR